jgi:MFS family permease
VLLFAAFNVVYVASAYPAGIAADRFGRKRVLVAGLAVFALVYLGFAVAREAVWIWPLFIVYGLYHGLTNGVSRAYVAGLVTAEYRGSALGAYSMITGLVELPASATAGLLWARFGAPAPFFVGAACAASAAVALTWYGVRLRERRA